MLKAFLESSKHDLSSRVKVGFFLALVLIAVCAIGANAILVFMGALSIIIINEFINLTYDKEKPLLLYAYIFLMVVTPFLALWIYKLNDSRILEIIFYLSISTTIATDTCAYIGGRCLGGKYITKLAPTISPNKTLIGAMCGFAGGVITFIVTYSIFLSSMDITFLVIQKAILITAVAILADLGQSAVKRSLEVKDSGFALGAHGGYWDRFDAFIPVFYVTTLILI